LIFTESFRRWRCPWNLALPTWKCGSSGQVVGYGRA